MYIYMYILISIPGFVQPGGECKEGPSCVVADSFSWSREDTIWTARRDSDIDL